MGRVLLHISPDSGTTARLEEQLKPVHEVIRVASLGELVQNLREGVIGVIVNRDTADWKGWLAECVRAQVKVIVVTAEHAEPASTQEAIGLGAAEYMATPVAAMVLLDNLSRR